MSRTTVSLHNLGRGGERVLPGVSILKWAEHAARLRRALAIDGESRGLTYAVESDYTPRWLIDGPPAGLLEHFKTLYEVTGES